MTNLGTVPLHKQDPIRTSLLILAAATLLVYSISFFNKFVLDDEVIIVNNPQTLSLRNIPEVLLAPDLIKPYYRPLNRATYLLDYRLAGMNPAWYHGVNVFIHLGNVILLYLVCLRLLPDRTAALVAALIFAVHPANSEAVNFISARNTLLALFFSLASFLAFLEARGRGKRLPLLSALFFFCGLLSKETAFMLIGVIALCTFVPLQGGEKRMRFPEWMFFLLPYLVATVLYFMMRYSSLQGIVGTALPADGVFSRLARNYHVIPQYLGLLLFPVDLTLFHKVPQGGMFTPPWYLPAWLLLLAGVGIMVRSRNRVALFCLSWIALNYAPISNIVPIPSDQLTERYLYFPAVGFFIILGVFFSWVHSQARSKHALWGITAVVIVAFAAMTLQRNLDWKNNLSLFSSGARNDPTSPAAHYNLGTAYQENGDLPSARREWEKTLAIDPTYADALTQMGTLAAVQGDLLTAEQYYLAALSAPLGVSDPDKSMAHYNLGKIYEKRQQSQRALHHYRRFLANVPITYLEYKPDAERRIARLGGALPLEQTR
jgi:hypothetical protein